MSATSSLTAGIYAYTTMSRNTRNQKCSLFGVNVVYFIKILSGYHNYRTYCSQMSTSESKFNCLHKYMNCTNNIQFI